MLEMTRLPPPATEFTLPPTVYDWKWMLKALLRRPLPIIVIPLLCMLVTGAYVAFRPSHYTAATILNITNLRLSSSDQDTFYAEALFDPTFLETQIQIIASEPIARQVIAETTPVALTESEEQDALKGFRAGLSVQRVGQSNLVQIAYTHVTAQPAADIANAVAQAYIDKLRTDREKAVQSASSWLRERLRGVGAQAQIVSEATPPVDKSDPRGITIIAGAVGAGAIGGAMLALLLGFLDRRIRDPKQVFAATGVECLGIVPRLDAGAPTASETAVAGQFSLLSAAAILHEVERGPASPLWQALRSASAIAAGPSARPQRLAVTSTLPGEGATTIAANYALLAVKAGRRVLLVDAQGYDPALSRQLVARAGLGLADFQAASEPDLARYVLTDPRTGLHFLPFGAAGNPGDGPRMLWTDRMSRLFEQAYDYDLIVFDMPSLVATGDWRAATPFIDTVLLVLEWNAVKEDEVGAALALAGPIRERLIGAVVNKALLGRRERWLSPEIDIVARQSRLARAVRNREKR